MAENLSGIPPVVTLSGLSAGPGGFSGITQRPQSGGLSGTQPGRPGMTGGLSLAELIQLLGAQGGGDLGAANQIGLLQPIGAGGLGTQSFSQPQGGQQGIAGQMSSPGPGGVIAGQNTSIDPIALLTKLFGVGKTAVGLASPVQGDSAGDLGTRGDTGGQSLSDQMRTSSPVNTGGAPMTSPFDYSPEALQKFKESLEQPGATFEMAGAPGPGLGVNTTQGLSGAPAQLGASTTGGLNISGALQGGLGSAGGLANLYQAIQSGNVGQGVGGGLQGAGGLAQLLKSSPGLMNALAGAFGISAQELSGALTGIGAGASGLGGLLSLVQGARSGNPLQIGTGALGVAQGASGLYGTLTGQAAPGVASALTAIAPETAAQIASAFGVTAANASAEAISAALSNALAGAGAVAAPIIMAITSYISNQEEMNARQSGWWNNPIKGALYSNAVSGVQNAQNLLGGDLSALSTSDLLRDITGGTNSLLPYFRTAEGGKGAIRASDTVTGTLGQRGWAGDTPAAYTGRFQTAEQSLVNAINEAMRRGITYQQLGGLPVTGDWGLETLDAPGRAEQFYAGGAGRYDPEAQQLIAQAQGFVSPTTYQQVPFSMGEGGTGWMTMPVPGTPGIPADMPLTPLNMLRAAEGQAPIDAAGHSVQSELLSSMYGGTLWEALARMGGGGMQDLIQQHFDPWATIRGYNPQQLVEALNPYVVAPWMAQQNELSGRFLAGGTGGEPGIGPGEGGIGGGID